MFSSKTGTADGSASSKKESGGNSFMLDTDLAISGLDNKDQRIQLRRNRIEIKRTAKTNGTDLTKVNGQKKKLGGKAEDGQTSDEKAKPSNNATTAATTTASGIGLKREGELQIIQSRRDLDMMTEDTTALISNLKVSLETREINRKSDRQHKLEELSEKKEEQLAVEEQMSENISQGFQSIPADSNDPYSLNQTLLKQKQACEELIKYKNSLLADYKRELKRQDEIYVDDIKRHGEEIEDMIKRMSTQQNRLRSTMLQELQQIEQALMLERSNMIQLFMQDREKWTETRRQLEIEHLEKFADRAETHLEQLNNQRTRDAEDYNLTKINLETNIQVVEQQLQQMKATYQLNSEKLEYNFQVLKKRDEENTITVTTQKRRINRLNDTVNALRQKVAKQEESYRKEYHQLSDEYSRILSQFKEFKQKFFRFQSSDDKIFNDVWNMNKHEAEEMISKVLTADKIIWHKHLGSAWRKPAAFENLQQRKQSAELTQSGSSLPPEIQPKVFSHEEFQKLFSNKQTKEALSLMVDECAPILVEERLQKLLAIIPGEEQKLMKLDCIFKAMRITAIDDVHLLETYFFKDDKLIPAQHTMRAILQFLDDRAAKEAASEDNAPVDTIFVRKSEEGESEDEASMNYWKALRDIVSNKSFVQWDIIEKAMLDYFDLLQERFSVKSAVDNLEQTNAELKQLLEDFIANEPESGLEVPPSRVRIQI